jgi:hypothetical protein
LFKNLKDRNSGIPTSKKCIFITLKKRQYTFVEYINYKNLKNMKTENEKNVNKKFDLKKMKVAKLKNIHLINGGLGNNDDIKTVTDVTDLGQQRQTK